VIRIYKIGSEITGPSAKKIGDLKHQNLAHISDNFACNLMAKIPETKEDIVEQKTALKTAIPPTHAHLI